MANRRSVAVVGAGVGGLAAAALLARHGFDVQVFEARGGPGGLASAYEVEGFRFDAGPYILLDRPGLEWVFSRLECDLGTHVQLRRIERVYEVSGPETSPVEIDDSLEETAARIERGWPSHGRRYQDFVERMWRIYGRLQPLQRVSAPNAVELARVGGWRSIAFLLRSLRSVLKGTGLPGPVQNAIGIWTHVAGQNLRRAPSPLALVSALIHHAGAWYPARGIGQVAESLAKIAGDSGVRFHYNTAVEAIVCRGRKAQGVRTSDGSFVPADAVVANSHGVGTYLELLDSDAVPLPRRTRRWLERLPLQSPGICIYLAVKGRTPPPYLRFHLPGDDGLCRLLITPSNLWEPGAADEPSWWPARLLAPMSQDEAESAGASAARDYRDRVLAETWWQECVPEHRVLAVRLPADWGREFHLYRNSMNPAMTASFMRAGRLRHRSPYVGGLYLAGSSTHPGQWVSFCAVSGILAADCLREDFG